MTPESLRLLIAAVAFGVLWIARALILARTDSPSLARLSAAIAATGPAAAMLIGGAETADVVAVGATAFIAGLHAPAPRAPVPPPPTPPPTRNPNTRDE